MSPRVSIIAAMAENRVIGLKNDMPWHLPEDLRRFKALTAGKPVVMGRKTFESIVTRNGRALPGRASIVVSRSGFAAPDAIVVHGLPDALEKAVEIATAEGLDEIFIIGGAQIYAQALPLADRIYLTEIAASPEGDAFFPEIPSGRWRETSREERPAAAPNLPACRFVVLDAAGD